MYFCFNLSYHYITSSPNSILYLLGTFLVGVWFPPSLIGKVQPSKQVRPSKHVLRIKRMCAPANERRVCDASFELARFSSVSRFDFSSANVSRFDFSSANISRHAFCQQTSAEFAFVIFRVAFLLGKGLSRQQITFSSTDVSKRQQMSAYLFFFSKWSCGNPQTFAYVRKLLLSASRPISSVGWRHGSCVFK